MTDDLETIQTSLKRLLASKDADRESNAKALTVAMHGIQAALAELIDAGERSAEEAQAREAAARDHKRALATSTDRIVSAIKGIQLEGPEQKAPIVTVEATTVNVEAPTVTVQAPPPAVNNITLPEQPERPRPIRYEVENEFRGGYATGKMLITPIYR